MHHKHFRFILAFGSAFGLGLNQAHADGQSKPQSKNTTAQNQSDPFTNVNLIEGMKSGLIDAKAVGTGDGRMTISVQNKTNRRLRVILPPGLIASGASGQMGGMGGGMGGMGGGGMGGGGMGGMGGGMRSVPPSSLPFATLAPNQTRNLPTPLVAIGQSSSLPAKGEELQLSDAAGLDQRIQNALTRLAFAKAPTVIGQMVMWNLSSGMSWEEIARKAKGSATTDDIALAKDLAQRLQKEDALKELETGKIHWEVTSADSGDATAKGLTEWFKNRQMLGLVLQPGVPVTPERPSMAIRVQLHADNQATVVVQSSDGTSKEWVNQGKFNLPIAKKAGESSELFAARISDELADGVLSRVVRVQVTDKKVDGRKIYSLRVDNASPLVLSGVAVKSGSSDKEIATIMNLSVRPHKSVQIPLDPKSVSRFGLAGKGVKAIGADLTAL